jgi:hypothetical protein
VLKSGHDLRISKCVDQAEVTREHSVSEPEPTQRYLLHIAIKQDMSCCHCPINKEISPAEKSDTDCKGNPNSLGK